MKAGHIARKMDHGPSDAAARVVAAQLDGMRSRDDARFIPVQLVRAGLVTDPVLVGVPKWPRVEDDHAPPLAGQPLCKDGAPGSAADDHDVNFVVALVAAHVAAQLM